MMKDIAYGFEALHDVHFILGTINDYHIRILSPSHNLLAYKNRIGFYLCLLQEIVDADYKF